MRSRSKFYLIVLFLVLSSSVVCGQSEKKIAYGILIDNTGSLRSQFEQNGVVVDGMIPKVVPSDNRNRSAGAELFSPIGWIGP